jgi:hypothetical protein
MHEIMVILGGSVQDCVATAAQLRSWRAPAGSEGFNYRMLGSQVRAGSLFESDANDSVLLFAFCELEKMLVVVTVKWPT